MLRNISRKQRIVHGFLCTILPFVSQVMYAAGEENPWEPMNNGIKGIYANLITLCTTILGIGALLSVVAIVYEIFKGEKEAAHKLIYWAMFLVIGFTILSVIGQFIK